MANEPCSKCKGALDTSGSPPWCKKCRATYQREYQSLRKEMTESRGYAAGVSAMREYLARQFARYGTAGSFSGSEIAGMINGSRGPLAE